MTAYVKIQCSRDRIDFNATSTTRSKAARLCDLLTANDIRYGNIFRGENDQLNLLTELSAVKSIAPYDVYTTAEVSFITAGIEFILVSVTLPLKLKLAYVRPISLPPNYHFADNGTQK